MENGWHQRFIELMPFGNTDPSQFVSSEEILEKISRKYTVKKLPQNMGVAQRFMIDNKIEMGIISPLSNAFCSDCNRLRLTADGKLRGCLLHDNEIDLLSILRSNGGDTDIIQAFVSAVRKKPAGHEVHRTDFRKCVRPMNTIGG
jgi:cyclic pyranopterin phosphate synthase